MKKYLLFITSIIIMTFTFINGWYSDELFSEFFIFALIPDFIILVAFVICVLFLVKSIHKKEWSFFNFLAIIILILTIIIIFFFPFRLYKTEFELDVYEEQRREVINMVIEQKFEVDASRNVKLPNRFRMISASGEIKVYQNDKNGVVIGFWIFRGLSSSGSSELIYSSQGKPFIESNKEENSIQSIIELKNNWFYVETDY